MSVLPSGEGPDTVDHIHRDEELCDRFEDALRAGRRVSAESFLRAEGIDPASASPELFSELAKLEADYADATGTQPGVATGADTAPARVPEDALPGAPSIPGYRIVGSLGGMGVVYEAGQLNAPRRVALKVVRAGPHASAAELARFKTEVASVARLSHPHVVQVFEVGESGGLPFFSLELCTGGSLAQKLAGNPMEPRDAAALVEKLALGVQAAPAEKVIHRDLKPANILLAADGTPMVTDFGLAKLTDAGDPATCTGAVMGTPSYMAPGQAGGGAKDAGPAADVYALGAVLYECLTGRPPFKGASAADTLVQVKTQEPVAVSALVPGVPRDLEAVCHKCLEKEPTRRYAGAAELAADLRNFLEYRPTKARPVGSLGKLRRWVKRNRGLSWALGAVTAALLLGTAVSTGFGWWALSEADKAKTAADRERDARQEAQRLLAQASIDEGIERLDAGDFGLGLLRVTHALTVAPDSPEANEAARRVFGTYRRYANPPYARLVQQFRLPGEGRKAAFSPDGVWIVVATPQAVSVREVVTGREVVSLPGLEKPVASVLFSADASRVLVVAGEGGFADPLAYIWQLSPPRRIFERRLNWLLPEPISPDCGRIGRHGAVAGEFVPDAPVARIRIAAA